MGAVPERNRVPGTIPWALIDGLGSVPEVWTKPILGTGFRNHIKKVPDFGDFVPKVLKFILYFENINLYSGYILLKFENIILDFKSIFLYFYFKNIFSNFEKIFILVFKISKDILVFCKKFAF